MADRQECGADVADDVTAELCDTPQGEQDDHPEEQGHDRAQNERVGIMRDPGPGRAQRRVLEEL